MSSFFRGAIGGYAIGYLVVIGLFVYFVYKAINFIWAQIWYFVGGLGAIVAVILLLIFILSLLFPSKKMEQAEEQK